MPRISFGHCIGCDQPIRPPYLQFVVQKLEQQAGEDPTIHSWEEVDVCNGCASKLTAENLLRLVAGDPIAVEASGG